MLRHIINRHLTLFDVTFKFEVHNIQDCVIPYFLIALNNNSIFSASEN